MIKEVFKRCILPVLIFAMVFAVCMTLVILPMHFFSPVYTVQATVTAIGYKGITIEYKGAYGQDLKKKINVNDVTEYQVGDIVFVEVKVLSTKIVEESEDEL